MYEIKGYQSNVYHYNGGGYGITSGENITWYYCREQFHRQFNRKDKERIFFFRDTKERLPKIIKFIEACEKRLNVVDGCKIELTNFDSIIRINIAGWWSDQLIRSSLFTILLRCGMNYNGDFEKALYSKYDYTVVTKASVAKFFQGHTHFVGKASSWVRTFNQPKNGKVDKSLQLIKPVVTKPIEKLSLHSLAKADQILELGLDKKLLRSLIAEAIDELIP